MCITNIVGEYTKKNLHSPVVDKANISLDSEEKKMNALFNNNISYFICLKT